MISLTCFIITTNLITNVFSRVSIQTIALKITKVLVRLFYNFKTVILSSHIRSMSNNMVILDYLFIYDL